MYEIIFEVNTPAGKLFDVILLWCIVLSVVTVMLESVADIQRSFGPILRAIEWAFTVLFTVEYVLRVACVPRARSYIFSFYGIIDLLAVVPTYVSIILTGSQYLLVIRAVRLLRIFRVLKLARFLGEATVLSRALHASRHKITVFLGAVFTIVVIVGALLFLIEGEQNGFTSIPKSMYWAIVTLTTVGYGDITPQTTAGQALSAMLMIIGYGVLAVPTGIVTVELTRTANSSGQRACVDCSRTGHDDDACFCKYCGTALSLDTAA